MKGYKKECINRFSMSQRSQLVHWHIIHSFADFSRFSVKCVFTNIHYFADE